VKWAENRRRAGGSSRSHIQHIRCTAGCDLLRAVKNLYAGSSFLSKKAFASAARNWRRGAYAEA